MTSGARSMILFKLLRCGTNQEDKEIIHLFSKVMEEDVGYEVGVHGNEHDEHTSAGPAKKKRRANDAISLEEKIEKLVDITTSTAMVSQIQKPKFDGLGVQQQLDIMRAEIKCRTVSGEAESEEVKKMKECVGKMSWRLFQDER
ncbi:hypothetical protein BWQ96_08919 [Gracilariopsis chorda]|uniref:Uncharacterized protein n=1 Tax=Gracilariopsis chorda TaxID=448386 RepID=A0A2V3IGZ6_9FLOR|nr:hypothetical protein BWQ96_08919 [Gracilariopsis chorda]|eukprot:PXF41349.1 hypothetical protein BWQ96_08919 [Gracilariopsis chorda]